MNYDYELSVTRWIGELKGGDQSAFDKLWRTYFDEVVRLARNRMSNLPRRMADEEDVAVSVFRCLSDAAAEKRIRDNMSRTDLWKLLVVITKQKITDQVRHAGAVKRGGGAVRGESVFLNEQADFTCAGIEQVAAEAPTPDFLFAIEEQRQRLITILGDETLGEVVRLRMEGFSNEEIAQSLSISLRSVERKLNLIRERWSDELSKGRDCR